MTVTLVIGAAASGKSAYAESLCLGHDGPRVYLATMESFGEEGARRIARHRALREGKGFSTLERTRDVGAAAPGLPRGCTLLLEDVGNLVANELFAEGGLSPRDPDAAAREVLGGIERLAQAAAYTVVVTVDVFADGMRYDEGTEAWRRALARVNAGVAALADRAVEVVCGIPVWMKGEETYKVKIVEAICAAFGTFSRIPVPKSAWTDFGSTHALAAFPLVGLAEGLLMTAWGHVANLLGVPATIVAAVLVALPVAVTGGIHLDGLCDTSDALASWAPRERKLEDYCTTRGRAPSGSSVLSCTLFWSFPCSPRCRLRRGRSSRFCARSCSPARFRGSPLNAGLPRGRTAWPRGSRLRRSARRSLCRFALSLRLRLQGWSRALRPSAPLWRWRGFWRSRGTAMLPCPASAG